MAYRWSIVREVSIPELSPLPKYPGFFSKGIILKKFMFLTLRPQWRKAVGRSSPIVTVRVISAVLQLHHHKYSVV
jgi:hypothetical protein